MQNPWLFLKEQIAKELKIDADEIEEPVLEYGDFSYPCFSLAKKLNKDPKEIANELEKKLKIKFIKKIQAIGGYLNFYIDWESFGNELLKLIDNKYGVKKLTKKNIVIDYSSPNPAHPFHMGTTRSTIIGESLCRILENQGFNPIKVCYINDVGKQAAVMLFGYQMYAKNKKPEGKSDVWLGKLYFKVSKKIEENPQLEEKIFELLKKYEDGDKEIKKLAKKVFIWCLNGFKENWGNIGIKFDYFIWESQLIEDGRKIVEELKNKNLTFESEGATVLKLEPELPNTIIVRKGGTGLYLPRDLVLSIWKYKKFNPHLNLWVVAEDQKLHFQQEIKALDLLGYKNLAKNSIHLWFSMVLLEGEKMSARKGRMVLWDDLLEEGIKKASKEIEKRWKLSKKEKEKRAKQIALASIICFILKYSPEKIVNFNWNDALRFEGNTGPYLQYTYARAKSILKKARAKKFDASYLKDEMEINILKLLTKYPEILEKSVRELRPHYLANYLFNLCESFNLFYQNLPVLKADKGTREARLKLVETVLTVLKSGSNLLGIEMLEKM